MVKRFSLEETKRYDGGYWLEMAEDTQGDWVLHDEHEEIVGSLLSDIEKWKEASGLEIGGDPDGVTPDDLIRDLNARDIEDRRLRELAYLGEHHFPDLTYKARLEELLERRLGRATKPNVTPDRTPPYPRCPECGRAVVGAAMTSGSIIRDGEMYYHPDAISVYCESGDCNWERKIYQIPSPSKDFEP